jgi:hypothetical protein
VMRFLPRICLTAHPGMRKGCWELKRSMCRSPEGWHSNDQPNRARVRDDEILHPARAVGDGGLQTTLRARDGGLRSGHI